MEKRVDEHWDPEPGDMLMGHLTDATVEWRTKWAKVPLVVVTEHESNRTVGVWLSKDALVRLFNEQRPALGSGISIKYLGTEMSKSSSRTFHNYAMVTETRMRQTEPHWIEDVSDELERRKTGE